MQITQGCKRQSKRTGSEMTWFSKVYESCWHEVYGKLLQGGDGDYWNTFRKHILRTKLLYMGFGRSEDCIKPSGRCDACLNQTHSLLRHTYKHTQIYSYVYVRCRYSMWIILLLYITFNYS